MKKDLPRLSIGIIFKNEIRSLERCLKALEPLRQAVPCQLIMADTGSTDGCREIAEKYADILIDFPWINDFSAARNAVIEQATGEWFLVVDDDEYLDDDFSQLTAFFNSEVPPNIDTVSITQRNYFTYELDGPYSDFLALRLFRVSAGLRYSGAIHEALETDPTKGMAVLPKVVLKHDGYVKLNSKEGKAKRERNLKPLREELKKDPDDLRRLLQYIESGYDEQDFLTRVYHAVDLIETKHFGWNSYGASIMRHAIIQAQKKRLPELEKWIALANERFSESYFIRIDVDYITLIERFEHEKYEDCIPCGERLLKAYADYKAGGLETIKGQTVGVISMAAPIYEESVRVILAKSHLEMEEAERAYNSLSNINCTVFEEQEVLNLANVLLELQTKSYLDTAQIVRHCWESLTSPVPSAEKAKQRRSIFLQTAAASFSPVYQTEVAKKENFCRHAYTAFLPLADVCEVGIGAALMRTEDPAEMERLLRGVEKWNELPVSALSHALERLPSFPLPDKPLHLEEMDNIARRMSSPAESVRKLALHAAEEGLSDGWQQLNWTRSLVLAAVRSWGWKEGDADKAMELARCFARLEKVFLPRFYAEEVLREENLSALPPMHRFGWYCARAFDALDSGDAMSYVKLLREGLAANKGMKPLVEFLTEHTPELQAPSPVVSDELSALAEQIRTILANYSPDDPALAQLKASPAYQKVAWMIEAPDTPALMQLPQ